MRHSFIFSFLSLQLLILHSYLLGTSVVCLLAVKLKKKKRQESEQARERERERDNEREGERESPAFLHAVGIHGFIDFL